jgi:CBS domain-containing protein
MSRYGYDYDWGGGWQRRYGGFGGGELGYGRGYRAWGRYPSDGWSRPDFNVSLGAFGGRRPELDYTFETWGAYDTTGGAYPGGYDEQRDRATMQPWGGGDSDASRVRARDLMTENPEVVTPDATLAEAARLMRDLDVGIVPVVTDLDTSILQGVITDRDITIRAAAEGKDMNSSRVADFMTREVETVSEGASVREVFSVMKREQVRRVPVTDTSGRLVGIIAQADLAVDYAGLDTEREAEVEEVIERISEPARPRSRSPQGRDRQYGEAYRYGPRFDSEYDRDFGDRLRHRWRTVKRGARHLLRRGERQAYDDGWR